MHLFTTFPGIVAVLLALLDSCRSQTSTPAPPNDTSFNAPCNNCYNNCKNVQTTNNSIANSVKLSPFYQPIVTVLPGDKQTDSICMSYMEVDGERCFIEFVVTVYCDATYSVSMLIVSDTNKPGMFRSEGTYLDDSGESSFVTNAYTFGSVCCPNSTAQPITAIYSCPQFTDCSLPRATSDFLYAISDTPYISCDCLDQLTAQFGPAGFVVGQLTYPPCILGPKCVTSFNGAPVINADRVPASSSLAYPPTDCASSD